ncbi:hypothetical protein H6P81_019793 [Aristolochia fimbriata]|uniref:Uncharacterized protein n=1 Tax=Aristolochia fimbriata TaxID=158543 RepID=A0AAV7DST6_ARIFI|nr:hypothetical protein H6P81_019793 [Aristolochia fimbriata]
MASVSAFEVFHQGSWQPTECVRIKQGGIFLKLEHHDFESKGEVLIKSLRLRSRKATSVDCQHILGPGTDVCLFSSHPNSTSQNQENLQPAWHDAKIISILRRPHRHQCTCQFFVSFFKKYNPCGKKKRTLEVTIMEISIDNIYILQKLKRDRGGGSAQVTTIQDCKLVDKSKIFGPIFSSSEIAWLVVLSILNGMDFEIRVKGHRLMYLITKGWTDDGAIYFERCNGFPKPKVGSISSISSEIVVARDAADEKNCAHDDFGNEFVEFHDFIDLRRSSRQRFPPDRYMGFADSSVARNSLLNYREEVSEMNPAFKSDEYKTKLRLKSDEPKIYTSLLKKKKRCSETSDKVFGSVSSLHQKKPKFDQDHSCLKPRGAAKRKISESCPGYDEEYNFSAVPRKKTSGKKYQMKSGCISVAQERFGEESCLNELKQTMEKCMKGKEFEKENLEKNPNLQTEEDMYDLHLNFDFEEESNLDERKETSEYEDLWKEMENALYELNLQEDPLLSKPTSVTFCEGETQTCQHEYRLDERVGLVCQLCYTVVTDIKHIFPPYMESKNRYFREKKASADCGFAVQKACNLDSKPLSNALPSMDTNVSHKHENIWSPIPNLETKLRIHQKMAFEFLWKNIAGSLNPKETKNVTTKSGGCILSHSPGSGKTLTVIAFLASYLNLFPEKRPLIVVPKIIQYVWLHEFKKWGFPFQVHQIHSQKSYHSNVSNRCRNKLFGHLKLNKEMKHIADCLDKLSQWNRSTSVLLMSYSCFSSMMNKERKYLHELKIPATLQEKPTLLILDEGHNPRSTGSKLRKALMEVKTGLRILLSGTLFQNNFVEYFNTLCLARPNFIFELVGQCSRTKLVKGKKSNDIKEKCARKFFVDNVANRINSNVENVRKIGLDMLSNITGRFVHVYISESSEDLPGMQSYTILLRSTDIQEKFLAKLHRLKQTKRNCLELDLLITVGSMHPWLISSISCAGKYFGLVELEELEKYKLDITRGSKVKFIVELVQQCVARKEKMLIFCRNIPPIKYIEKIFELFFGWKKGHEILVLQGDQEMSERAMVMDKFKEKGAAATVLLASTTACAEGISLVAASRVILLDSEWNPAKTKQAIARAFRPGQEKVVYVYQLLAFGTMEEDKYGKTAVKELQSKMIFSGNHVKQSTDRKTDDIDDDVLKRLVEDDGMKSFEMILKHEKACDNMAKAVAYRLAKDYEKAKMAFGKASQGQEMQSSPWDAAKHKESAAALAKELRQRKDVSDLYRKSSELYLECGRSKPASDALENAARVGRHLLMYEVCKIILPRSIITYPHTVPRNSGSGTSSFCFYCSSIAAYASVHFVALMHVDAIPGYSSFSAITQAFNLWLMVSLPTYTGAEIEASHPDALVIESSLPTVHDSLGQTFT